MSGHVGPLRELPPAPWMEHGACRDYDPNMFFPERGEDHRAAAAVCETCPVRAECGEYAIHFNVQTGVWGGMSERQRRQIRRSRRTRS